MTAIFGIVGWKNSGKTTLVAALVREFTKRGLTVSTLKHAHHNFSIDHPNTDSTAHREAGAQEVAVVSPRRWAIMHEVASSGEEPSLETMVAKLAPCDLVLVEGFKGSDIPKIEAVRTGSAEEKPLWPDNSNIVAIATDTQDQDCPKPLFDLNDIESIANFIAQHARVSY